MLRRQSRGYLIVPTLALLLAFAFVAFAPAHTRDQFDVAVAATVRAAHKMRNEKRPVQNASASANANAQAAVRR
ncbi:hypothetical protein C483_15542 [Natrialba hulunbeirensis JCM 10989]|uniref:Uncharacterized protein n=1 Tax=Natrialba hulunbeirensis JCM 10989 TaxID=1227493 RepID=L9ZT90_9EURY|nr:hypothetical protein C483_15542 [Natrialba hulunbeirensis JCM 10989]